MTSPEMSSDVEHVFKDGICVTCEESGERHADVMAKSAGDAEERPREPIEFREVSVEGIDERIITVIAVPYEQPTPVSYRGEKWYEVFERGSCKDVMRAPNRVRVNRNHDRGLTVGKTVRFDPEFPEGLKSEIRIAKTPLGDETLQLASEDMLSVSIGFAPKGPGGQYLDRRNMTRRIKNAYLDHISFVESPAYDNARVMSVREESDLLHEQRKGTPNLDREIAAMNDILQWTANRLRSE